MDPQIATRLRECRLLLGLKQSEAAELAGVQQSDVSRMEAGKAKFVTPEYMQFLHTRAISLNYIFAGEGEATLNAYLNAYTSEEDQDKKYISSVAEPEPLLRPQILIATQDTSGNLTVPIVNRKAAASYLSGYQTQEYFEELDALTVPAYMLRGGQGLIIQATNDSMEDTIFEGDMLLCRYMEAAQWDEIPDFSVCVIVSESRGIQVKRVKARFRHEGFIRCKSDNRTYRSFNLFAEDILQIWQVSLLLTTNMPNRADTLYRKIDHLEENFDDMRELYEQMRQELQKLKGNQG